MATITRVTTMGSSTFTFVFNDVTLQMIEFHAVVEDGKNFVLEFLSDDELSVDRVITLPPGNFDRTLPPPQRRRYTLTDSVSSGGIRPQPTMNLKHRIRGV